MSLRFHEIAEARHRILNPFDDAKLALLADVCRLRPGLRQLDLCCGKAELLARWAHDHGIHGTGVDISTVFLAAAAHRAAELGVADRLEFVLQDAATYPAEPGAYDVVSCIGATWIGQGLVGTLALMKPALAPGGLLLVGEPYWIDLPPDAVYAELGIDPRDHATLAVTLACFEAAGTELVEMVLANPDTWDRYVAAQWLTVSDWLAANPDHADAPALRAWITRGRRDYMTHERRYLGWGVFVLRVTAVPG